MPFGGEWAVEGPVMIRAAKTLGASVGQTTMGVAYGNMVGNMFQPFWAIPLLGIHEAYHDPAAIKGSLRIWGNGGLFGITGYFWNKNLGRFRIFATDPRRAVVLKLHDRTVVVSPAEPEAFLEELALLFPRLRRPENRGELPH